MSTLSLVAVGVNHRSAPIDLLEKLAINDERLPKALHELTSNDDIVEAVVLSTCNRIEVYATVLAFHSGVQAIQNFFLEFCHVEPEELADRVYTFHEDGAAKHLFRVASGIDSMIVGESEILGQVRRAYQSAVAEGSVGRLLGAAFRTALRVGKRARTETGIGREPISVSSAAVELARRAFGPEVRTLADKKIAVVGAGKMGRLAAKALADSGATDVTVVNRSPERARELAHLFGGRAESLDDLDRVLTDVDIVLCSTTAPQSVIGKPIVERAMSDRGDRPLFIVDIAVPRDVEADVADVPGVVLRDIDDLKGVAEAGLGSRMGEVSKVESLIADEIARFMTWERSIEAAPTIAALVSHADEIRSVELERTVVRLDGLDVAQIEAIDQLSRRLVSKLLHTPIKKSKDLAGSKQGLVYLEALRELFELDDEPEL
ncbi:MAG: glutamyl-tRNA reductase [Actinomycetota bacterium]|nr:glutamyl-tRNA reductase [Actinomycetota bacterium]